MGPDRHWQSLTNFPQAIIQRKKFMLESYRRKMRQYSTIFLWQGDGKNGAFSWNTVSTKPSAVQFDYFPANRQPLSITLKL